MYSSNVVYDTDQVSSMHSSKKPRIRYHLRFYVNGVAFEASQLSPRAYHGAEVAVEDGVPAGGVRRRRRPGHRARGSRRLASRHTGTSAKRGAGLHGVQADRAERRLLLSACGRWHPPPLELRHTRSRVPTASAQPLPRPSLRRPPARRPLGGPSRWLPMEDKGAGRRTLREQRPRKVT